MTTSLFQRFITAISGRECTRCETLISAEADGVATPAELSELAAHLGTCKSCREHRAIVQASHSILTSLPRKEVPDQLSWRLLNAIAAEQATEKNIKRGGGLGSSVFLRPQYVGVFAAVVLGAAVFGIFWKNHSNGPVNNQIAVKPPVSGHMETQVAVLPKTNHPISIARHLTVSKPVVPTPSEIASQPVEPVHVRTHTASHLNFGHQGNTSELASLPIAPKTVLGNTSPHPLKRSVISAPHQTAIAKANTPVLPVKAPNMPADHNPVTAPSTQVAENLPTVSTPVAVAVAAVEPATIDGHSHLMREMQRLAQRTQESQGATVSLAAATIRPSYSNAVEMVGSSFR